jgi:hypothetical protein
MSRVTGALVNPASRGMSEGVPHRPFERFAVL